MAAMIKYKAVYQGLAVLLVVLNVVVVATPPPPPPVLSVVGYNLLPPETADEHPYLVIPEGSNINIRCEGLESVSVSWEESQDAAKTNRSLRYNLGETEFEPELDSPYLQELNIANLTYSDTGVIQCSYESNISANIYIFVESDENLLRLSGYFAKVFVYKDYPTYVGCRPTSPRVKMQIQNNRGKYITDKLGENDMRYTAQGGLWIYKADIHDAGTFTCQAKLGRKRLSTRMYLEIMDHDELTLPTPRIFGPYPDKPIIGGNFTIICNITVSLADYREGVHLDFGSGSSQLKELIESGRAVLGETMSDMTKDMNTNLRIKSRSLTVYDLQTNDSSVYTCNASGPHVTTSSRNSKDIKVFNPGGTYIGDFVFTGGTHAVYVLKEMDKAEWYFDIEVIPSDKATYSWYLPSGEIVKDGTLVRYVKNINGKAVTLLIEGVTIEDMGVYAFSVTVEGPMGSQTKNASLELIVKQNPRTNLSVKDYSHKFFTPNEFYDISCETIGYPIDKDSLSLRFYPCESFKKSDCDFKSGNSHSPGSLMAIDDVKDEQFHYNFISTTRLQAQTSGVFECRICNLGQTVCEVTKFDFFLSQAKDGILIEDDIKEDYYVEGDLINVRCVGSSYLYKDIYWTRHQQRNISHQLTTEFDIISLLEKDNVRIDDDGIYTCHAVQHSDDIIATNYQLNVRNMSAPILVESSLNGSEVHVEAGESLDLHCQFSGLPVPIITWTKDGEPIDFENTENLIKNIADDSNYETIRLAYLTGESSGSYVCSGQNRAGEASSFIVLQVEVPSDSMLVPLAIGGSIGAILIVCAISFLSWHIWVYRKKIRVLTVAELQLFERGDPESINPEMSVDEQADLLPFNKDAFEFPKSRLKLGKQLGSGAFGRVLKAEATGMHSWEPVTTVAVKMVKPQADITYIKALMSELKIMSHLGRHLNIVNLLGACTETLNQRELFVIVEYCRFGNLQKYLIRHRNSFINQIDPETGCIDFTIGKLVRTSDNSSVDYAREREMCEVSAHYVKNSSVARSVSQVESTNTDGYLEMRSPISKNPMHFDGDFSIRRDVDQYSSKQTYTGGGQGSVQSDMTQLTELPDKRDSSINGSIGSRASKAGPGWRSNVRGDYRSMEIKPITTKDLICWAFQVSRGMEYLSSRKVMHGDLACRNILLAADNVVKICDFGLAKDIYQTNNYHKKTDGPLPVKWLAIECLRDRIFSTQSDVWAFGIVLWEMFSLGKTPYPGMDAGERFYDVLSKGYRMPQPQFASRDIFKIMLDCWNSQPLERPRFMELTAIFGDFLEEGEKENYIVMSQRLESTRDPCRNGESEYLKMMNTPDYQNVVNQTIPEENGYLIPTTLSRLQEEDESLQSPETETLIQESKDVVELENGYLVPNKEEVKK